MSNLMVFIEDQIRDVYERVSLDVDTSAELLVRKLIWKFGLPRYDFSGRQIEYWLECPAEKKRPGQGKRLPDQVTLRQAGIRKGDLLQLVSPEGRRVQMLIQQILDEIKKEIIDQVTGKLKERVTEEVWQRVKEKLAEIEKTQADNRRARLVRQWVNSVDKIGGPVKVIDIIEKSFEAYKRYGPLVKVATALGPVLLIVLASLLQPLLAKAPVTLPTPTVTTALNPFPLPTIPVVTLSRPWPTPTPTSTVTSTPTFMPASTSTMTPTSTPTPWPTVTSTSTAPPAVNRAPVARDQSITVDQDTAAPITLIASDEDGDALTFNLVTPPSNGTLSGVLPNLIYTPNRGFSGFDSFAFVANDGQLNSNTAIVNISVTRANAPPVANDDTAATDQDTAISINVLANDFDPDSDPLIVTSITQGDNGAVINDGNGAVTYRPNPGFIGQDRFTYTISDGKGGTGTATVFVMVNPAAADLAVTQADSPDPVTIGGDLTYEIHIFNNGPAEATGVVVSDQLPSLALFRSATPSQGTCSQEKGVVTCQIGNLTTAAEATIIITVTMGQGQDQAQVVTNSVNVEGNQADPNPGNNASLEDTTVTQPDPPDLTVIALQMAGFATINAEGRIEVPIHVVVKNQGGLAAGIFKVSAEYSGPKGAFLTPFTVPGQDNIWYPYSSQKHGQISLDL